MRIALSLLVALPILLLALVGVRYLIRGTPVQRVRGASLHEPQTAVSDRDFRRTLELLSHVNLTPGNKVELLCSGDETYPRVYADLRAATQSITLQMYYCKPGRVADQFREILIERARAGVQVLFLLDAFGAQSLPEEYRESLRAAGVRVEMFRPVEWYALEKAYSRSHIRVIVVDATIGYTGGFGLDDKWLGDGRHPDQWRDTNVRFTGPAVMALQATFAAGWAEATGDLLTGPPFFDASVEAEDRGGVRAGVMHAAPSIGSTSAERFLALLIGGARRSLYITNAYFVPGDSFCELLERAARRGVDVRILTAGDSTDVRSTRFAGRAFFERLLAAGVRLWEYQPTMIHAKTVIVDGCFGCVGTMNFDSRSRAFNDETNLVFLDPNLGGSLHQVFEEDLAYSREITREAFARRRWTERVQERLFVTLERIL